MRKAVFFGYLVRRCVVLMGQCWWVGRADNAGQNGGAAFCYDLENRRPEVLRIPINALVSVNKSIPDHDYLPGTWGAGKAWHKSF